MWYNFLDSELSALRNSEALFLTCSVSITGTRLPDERAQAVRSLCSLLNYVRVDPRKGCITSRHTRNNAQGPLFTLSNEELARLERQNRQQLRPTNTTMVDHGGQDDLTAAMALMQQQM
ncbi:hypothetical protein F2Q69_00013200 [Brassica cretica]|uniref:Uncharacterized protein n=1 Tax=Brassica cretica TaxID=69181 RepID=A0A8S9R9C0_BRACR|nr:hypothetical protein F2Q69_00013200 [Brassica cretica]